MKAHHAFGAFSFVGMLALVCGVWMLSIHWQFPRIGQILALIIGATWVWAAMEAHESLEEETHREKRETGRMLQELARNEHDYHADAEQVKPWHG